MTETNRASKGKGYVKPAAPDLKSTWNKLSGPDRIVLLGVVLWVLLMMFMLINSTETDSIRIDIDYREPDNSIESERLA